MLEDNTHSHAWRIDPLPDFLMDHTLTEDRAPMRMREIMSRWTQLVASLWRWHDRATFALRFTSDCDQIRAFLLATPFREAENGMLRDDIAVLMRSHGIPAAESISSDPTAPNSPDWDLGGTPVVAEVRQHTNSRLWSLPRRATTTQQFRDEFAWLPKGYIEATPHIFPWWGPGGPFLLPMEKLISQPVPCAITVYLLPTVLTTEEWGWLSFLARCAQSVGDYQEQTIDQAFAQRKVDPAASLAGRLAIANLRRLSDKPFLTAVHCIAGRGHIASAQSVAGSIQSIVFEPPYEVSSPEDDRLPAAADMVVLSGTNDGGAFVATQVTRNPFAQRSKDEGHTLRRLPYLVDARGAATVFRLPINVRGGVPGFRVAQRPPDFHPGPRTSIVPQDHVLIGELHQGGLATIHRDQFTKHALVTGFTGSGKTVTVMSLIHQLHEARVPVLVIESAKHEYRSLLGVRHFHGGTEDAKPMWVFTVGNEACAPLRLNPFELLPGVRVEAHISRLQTCFEAALPPIGPLASMIGEALVDIYERAGWRLTDIGPEIGEPLCMRFPSMHDFYKRMSQLVGERGYEGEVRSNVAAAVLGRIKPLTVGTKGLMFRGDQEPRPGESRKQSLISDIFNRTSIVELNDLNIEDKALVTMFLLTFLREYRERNASHDGTLVHAAVVEEAHNVLENIESAGNVEGGGADTRFKAVQAFSQMLTEIRALGQSLIIVDQSPEKLAPDALRNTNIQIAHQLRDAEDRESVARAMIMEPEQRDFLGKLRPGHAALFVTGLERATFVRVPRYTGQSPSIASAITVATLTPPSDEVVREHMTSVTSPYRTGPFDRACESCAVRLTCDHRKPTVAALTLNGKAEQFAAVSDHYRRNRGVSRRDTVHDLVRLSVSVAKDADERPRPSGVWCAFVHLWHRDRFNWTEQFPEYGYDTLMNVLRECHPELDAQLPVESTHGEM
ncbi:MAG: ATP-binding protein [Phycisphaeraceae bacterium]|nr:ATP-binding protein [Phycisphaerales bacterium]MCB9843646.1 ATP-binding protein [Phycisphaeraceae bacterium]